MHHTKCDGIRSKETSPTMLPRLLVVRSNIVAHNHSCKVSQVFRSSQPTSRIGLFPLFRHYSASLFEPASVSCSMTTADINKEMPSPPYFYRSSQAPVLDLSDLASTISAADQKRRDAYDVSRKLQIEMSKIRNDMESESSAGSAETRKAAISKVQASLVDAIRTNKEDRTPRDANLSNRVEDFCQLLAFVHFLETGGWLPPSQCSSFGCTDEEYLAGACMGLCKELERYALGRATARDVKSVQAARDIVNEILDFLMQFDFRNGYLRRKYDGTKYALKTLETLLYELSVTSATAPTDAEDFQETQSKRAKLDFESASSLTSKPQQEMDDIRKRMEHRDELREKLIKKCRDGQKVAKQAIYSLHRKDTHRALELIQQCEECIQKELLPIVLEEPPLRSGSFANVLEEYAEAKLFYSWLMGTNNDGNPAPKGGLLLPEDFLIVHLEPDEYLGGLCDLTGEIGRYAVQRGTARDYNGVRECLEANSAVSSAIQALERVPGGIHKKMDQLRRSVEKIERMTYEMSLSKAAGINKHTDLAEMVDKLTDNDDGGE